MKEFPLHSLIYLCSPSYGAGTETSGKVEISFKREVVEGRHVLLVGLREG